MAKYTRIRYRRDGAVAWLALNRPAKLNAIDAAMITELDQALDEFRRDQEARVLVLHGEGRAFSAGFDLEETGSGPESMRRELEDDYRIIMRFWDVPKPVIAAVHGYCLGGAMELAAACDITIASSDAKFGEPEVAIGSGVVCLILPWVVGMKHAKDLLLTGAKDVDAARALDMGLISRITAPEDLLVSAGRIAATIAGHEPRAVDFMKREINRSFEAAGMRRALSAALAAEIDFETKGQRET